MYVCVCVCVLCVVFLPYPFISILVFTQAAISQLVWQLNWFLRRSCNYTVPERRAGLSFTPATAWCLLSDSPHCVYVIHTRPKTYNIIANFLLYIFPQPQQVINPFTQVTETVFCYLNDWGERRGTNHRRSEFRIIQTREIFESAIFMSCILWQWQIC